MHSASILLRNSVFASPNLQKCSSVRFVHNVTRIASHNRKPVARGVLYYGYNSHTSQNARVCCYPGGYLPSSSQTGSFRLFSTGNKDDPPEDEPEVKVDPPLFSSQLPATVAVPEVWPQVPVIAINRNPVFPKFIKLLEVRNNIFFYILFVCVQRYDINVLLLYNLKYVFYCTL